MNEVENAMAAARVLSFRLPMLWAMTFSPTPARRAEAMKMIVEKQMAVLEGMNAAALAALTTWMRLAAGQGVSAQTARREILQAAGSAPGARQCAAAQAQKAHLSRRSRLGRALNPSVRIKCESDDSSAERRL